MSTPSKNPIAEQLRQAIRQSVNKGEKIAHIAHRAGTGRGQVWRYLNGERTPNLTNAQSLARAMGYELVLRRRPKR